jgi:L-aspartate oxidase
VIRLAHPIVVGSGVAGLTVAVGLPRATVLTTGPLGSTAWAQGGIAAAVGPDDSAALHAQDTLRVSGGLGVRRAVEVLAEGGPAAIARLRALGAHFDVDDHGDLRLGREAGHRRRRIIHADGDATGREVHRTLSAAAVAADSIDVLDGWTALELIRHHGGIVGLIAADPAGERHELRAPAVILATGGIGQLYARTTNPVGVTGDGIALAARAGARLADLEFVQFHPTALLTMDDPLPLLTEALRGEGATLVDLHGRRFMPAHHADAELAPRDVVARAIWWQHAQDAGAFLDARSIAHLPDRFPTIWALAREAGLDPEIDVLPVSPAAHYFMGGVDVDGRGRTSLPGLWAVGEVASTGVHGANRLASNSLLEGLVYGVRVAADVATSRRGLTTKGRPRSDVLDLPLDRVPEVDDVRRLMWDHVGLIRTADGLEEAKARLLELRESLVKSVPGRVALDCAGLIAAAALRRTESRGSHYRADYPRTDPEQQHRLLVEPVFVGED